ncbi:MAG: WecB/TagA/CpsF family glycosyltransferase [Oscillospiraceae bacterium]|nr:WecB/TagA/CpsF family glycosyltransferase [Oscillospiraceae bacterium]
MRHAKNNEPKEKVDVLGVGFNNISIDEAVERAMAIIESSGNDTSENASLPNENANNMIYRSASENSRPSDDYDVKAFDSEIKYEKTYIVTPNPEIVWLARRDENLRNTLNRAGLVLPDGVGITIGARILGTSLSKGRVPGIDFVSALLEKMALTGKSVFLFGAKPGVAEDAGEKLMQKHPGLVIAGTADGYITNSDTVAARINSAHPDLLLVCLGAPKQELWMADNLSHTDVKICVGLGGALDVFAGRVKRAPKLFQKLGLEWLYRLVREPRRITRMIKLPLFIFVVIWRRLWAN